MANKFSRPQITNEISIENSHQEIPDILTGEIYKAKPSLGSEVKPDQKGKPYI